MFQNEQGPPQDWKEILQRHKIWCPNLTGFTAYGEYGHTCEFLFPIFPFISDTYFK